MSYRPPLQVSRKVGLGCGTPLAFVLSMILWLWASWLSVPTRGPSPITWACDRGVGVGVPGIYGSRYYTLRARDGQSITNPAYTFRAGELVYFSPDDNALSLVSPTKAQRWVALKSVVPAEWTVETLVPTPSGVILNADDDDLGPDSATGPYRAYTVDLSNGRMTQIPHVFRAASDSSSPEIVAVDDRWRLVRLTPRRDRVVGCSGEIRWVGNGWDYDFIHHTACLLGSQGVMLIDAAGHKTSWSLALPILSATRVALQPSLKQVWVEAEGWFGIGEEMLAYDYKGRLLYHGGVDPLMGPPIRTADPAIQAVLARIGGPPDATS